MRSDPIPAAAIRPLRRPLVRWYRRHARDLPWRRTRDPYSVWVSEVMLQQTTVTAVIPYWEKFLARFPDVGALARAKEEDVLAAWSGLGYYGRARALRRGAIEVMDRHAGRVPSDPAELLSLPGVGRYTAGAIASLAFARAAPIVDGNVRRVFSRLFALRDGTAAAKEASLWRIAEALVRGPDPGDLNQAVMELGAIVCTPRSPDCPACPVARLCRARAHGIQEEIPARKKPPTPRVVLVAAAVIARNGRVLLERRRHDGPFRGEWDIPAVVVGTGEDPRRALGEALFDRHGLTLRIETIAIRIKHAILSFRLEIRGFAAQARTAVPRSRMLRWVALDRLDEVPHSGATRKIVRAVMAAGQNRSQAARGAASLPRASSSGTSPRRTAKSFPSIIGTAPKATSRPAQ